MSILSKKLDLKVKNYNNIENPEVLGLCNFNKTGRELKTKEYSETKNNLVFDELLDLKNIDNGINYDGYFQTKKFISEYKDEILSHFTLKYENVDKNKVFVHVRLDDARKYNKGIEYYRKALDSLNVLSGYISSDSPDDELVKTLIKEYNLILYNDTPIKTINFAKDFNNIILSKGTFSFWIGYLSKAENIIYPDNASFHGDIFLDKWEKM